MPTPDPLPGLSTREAAVRLGVSQSDVLRRIRRGELQAERFERPGGTILRVLLPASEPTPEPPHPTPEAHQEPPEPRQDTSALALALLDRLDEREGQIRAQADAMADLRERLADLRERLGRAEAERDALRERLQARRWWRWW